MSETTETSRKAPQGQMHNIASGAKELIKKKNGELLFDPETGEFVLVNASDFGGVKKEIEAFDAFKPHMEVFFPEHKINEKEKAAEMKAVLAVMKEFIDAKDDKESDKIIKELAKKIEEKKEELLKSANNAAGHKMKSGDIKEYYWASGSNTVRSRMIRLRKGKVNYKWKTYKLDTREFNEELKKEKARKEKLEKAKEGPKEAEAGEDKHPTASKLLKHIKKPETEKELNLFEQKLFEVETPALNLVNTNFFEAVEQIDSGISAQMFRLSAEGAIESVVDWKNHKIKGSVKASGSAALFQGKGHFTVYLPDYDGWDVWATLRSIDPKLVKSAAKPLYLVLKFNIEGSAFVGACASIGVEAGLSLGESKKKGTGEAVAEASVDLFAGAKASAEASAAACMKLLSDKDIKEKEEWGVLGSASWSAFGAIGVGLTLGFKVGWYEGMLQYEAKMGVVLKLGAGTCIKGAVNPVKIGQFLYTIAVSVDWLYLTDIFDQKVHSLFQSIMMNCVYAERAIEDVMKEMKDHLPQIMDAATDVLDQDFSILKKIDDTFDNYIPGYSGFKQHRAEFWLLKSTYSAIREINREKQIKDNAITQTNFIEQTKRWKYATWQMKVNLITDMTQSGLFSKYSESEKQKAMLSVFRSARNSKEFQKIYLCITSADELFTDAWKAQFEQLKTRFK
jgi:hypothetical protein